MIAFFANIFGYVLNFIYELVKNYGLAIIIITLALRLAVMPVTKKTAMQSENMKKGFL